MVVHSFNPNTRETEAGGGQPGLQSKFQDRLSQKETLTQKQQQNNNHHHKNKQKQNTLKQKQNMCVCAEKM